MRIADMHWQQVEAYLKHDDRCIIPLGCVEQHAYLSLATDAILAEKLSVDSAESLGCLLYTSSVFSRLPSTLSHWRSSAPSINRAFSPISA